MNPVKLIIGFTPFLLFTVLASWLPVGWSALVGLVAAVVVIAITARGGLKTLPLVQAVILAAFTILGFVGGHALDTVLDQYGRGGASIILGLFIVVTATFAPFTTQFARESVPQGSWHSPQFIGLNRRISLVWGVAVLAVGACRIASALIGSTVSAPILHLLIEWGGPVLAIYLAFRYTKQAATAAASRTARPII